MKNLKDHDTSYHKPDQISAQDSKSHTKFKLTLLGNAGEELPLPQADLDLISPLIQMRLSDNIYKGEKVII